MHFAHVQRRPEHSTATHVVPETLGKETIVICQRIVIYQTDR